MIFSIRLQNFLLKIHYTTMQDLNFPNKLFKTDPEWIDQRRSKLVINVLYRSMNDELFIKMEIYLNRIKINYNTNLV